jgi:hypothetical protein
MSKVNFDEMSRAEVFLHDYPERAQIGLQQVVHQLARQEELATIRDGIERRLLGDAKFRQGVLDVYLAVATGLRRERIIDQTEQKIKDRRRE